MPAADINDPYVFIGKNENKDDFPENIRKAIADGQLVNVPSPHRQHYGRSLLHLAVWSNNIKAGSYLIEQGANINALDDLHDSPFLLAGAEGRLEILTAMVDHADRVVKHSGETSERRKAAIPDFTVVNRFGGSALIPACERGHAEVVKVLLERTGIDPDHYNDYKWTGLLEAVELGGDDADHVEIVKLLIKHGADVNRPDRNNDTPLKLARKNKMKRVCALLEAAGAHE